MEKEEIKIEETVPSEVIETAITIENNPAQKKTAKQKIGGFFGAAWEYIKFAKIELIVVFAAVFLDLVTKFLITKNLALEGAPFVVIKNFLQFRYVQNDRAAFGSGFGLDKLFGEQGVMTAFIIFSTITVSVFCYLLYRFRKYGLFLRITLALIIGGAFGNLYDRIAFGYVRDFVEIVFFGLDLPLLGRTFAIFNLADSALVVGMIMLMVYVLFIYKDGKKMDKIKKE